MAVISASLIGEPDEDTDAGPKPTTNAPSEPVPSITGPHPMSPDQVAAIGEAVATAVEEVAPGTDIGLAVYDRLTGSKVASVNSDQQFYTASVVKLLIGIHVLHDADWVIPTGAERDELAAMLSRSTDATASALWGAYGGTAIVREVAELIDLPHTGPPRDAGRWELTRMSPKDILRVYKYITNRMPPRAGAFMQDVLAAAPTRAADGFNQFFGIPDALPSAQRAIKQGWMRINDGLVLNTTGVVGPDQRYVVALLTQQPVNTSFSTGRAAVTAGIAALAPALATDA